MERDEGIRRIEDLIGAFSVPSVPDRVYIELLEEMVERAQTALDARRAERASDGGDDEDD